MYGWIGPMNCLDETHDKDNFFFWIDGWRFKLWVNIECHKCRLLKSKREYNLKQKSVSERNNKA